MSVDFVEVASDCYMTPSVVLDLAYALWPEGVSLDPFFDPESKVIAALGLNVRAGGDGWSVWPVPLVHGRRPTAFVNGPYSGDKPMRNARAVAENLERYPEVLNLCPAAIGSKYWARYVHPYCASVAALGRLAFPAGRDMYDKDGKLICKKGEAKGGNRTEIALVYYGQRVDQFERLCRVIGGWSTWRPS